MFNDILNFLHINNQEQEELERLIQKRYKFLKNLQHMFSGIKISDKEILKIAEKEILEEKGITLKNHTSYQDKYIANYNINEIH